MSNSEAAHFQALYEQARETVQNQAQKITELRQQIRERCQSYLLHQGNNSRSRIIPRGETSLISSLRKMSGSSSSVIGHRKDMDFYSKTVSQFVIDGGVFQGKVENRKQENNQGNCLSKVEVNSHQIVDKVSNLNINANIDSESEAIRSLKERIHKIHDEKNTYLKQSMSLREEIKKLSNENNHFKSRVGESEQNTRKIGQEIDKSLKYENAFKKIQNFILNNYSRTSGDRGHEQLQSKDPIQKSVEFIEMLKTLPSGDRSLFAYSETVEYQVPNNKDLEQYHNSLDKSKSGSKREDEIVTYSPGNIQSIMKERRLMHGSEDITNSLKKIHQKNNEEALRQIESRYLTELSIVKDETVKLKETIGNNQFQIRCLKKQAETKIRLQSECERLTEQNSRLKISSTENDKKVSQDSGSKKDTFGNQQETLRLLKRSEERLLKKNGNLQHQVDQLKRQIKTVTGDQTNSKNQTFSLQKQNVSLRQQIQQLQQELKAKQGQSTENNSALQTPMKTPPKQSNASGVEYYANGSHNKMYRNVNSNGVPTVHIDIGGKWDSSSKSTSNGKSYELMKSQNQLLERNVKNLNMEVRRLKLVEEELSAQIEEIDVKSEELQKKAKELKASLQREKEITHKLQSVKATNQNKSSTSQKTINQNQISAQNLKLQKQIIYLREKLLTTDQAPYNPDIEPYFIEEEIQLQNHEENNQYVKRRFVRRKVIRRNLSAMTFRSVSRNKKQTIQLLQGKLTKLKDGKGQTGKLEGEQARIKKFVEKIAKLQKSLESDRVSERSKESSENPAGRGSGNTDDISSSSFDEERIDFIELTTEMPNKSLYTGRIFERKSHRDATDQRQNRFNFAKKGKTESSGLL